MFELRSPAKINLFLRILKRRSDGYHELASLLQAISLYDTLHFDFEDYDVLTCSDPTIPTDGTNLVMKAIDLFRRKTGMTFGMRTHLIKRIPHQAGLGGGSSNAATTLWALNQMCGHPAEESELARWAAEIGSDISFFFSHGAAYCTGRGEKMRAVEAIPKLSLWIVKPEQGLSTPAVYKHLDVSQLTNRDPELFLKQIIQGQTSYFNDLEVPALDLMPQLEDFRQKLMDRGFKTVVMTGSGSAFFCLGDAVGDVTPIKEANVFSSPATFIQRAPGCWY